MTVTALDLGQSQGAWPIIQTLLWESVARRGALAGSVQSGKEPNSSFVYFGLVFFVFAIARGFKTF